MKPETVTTKKEIESDKESGVEETIAPGSPASDLKESKTTTPVGALMHAALTAIQSTSGFSAQENAKKSVTVTTKSELESAKASGAGEIIVSGSLASDLKKAKKIALAGAVTLAALGAALAAMPFTGGLSALAAAPIATLTGLEIAAIIAATSVGLSLVIAVFKDYEEVSYENGKLILRRKANS